MPKPEAVYVPLNPTSPYKQGFHWQSAPRNRSRDGQYSDMLQLRTVAAGDYKIGADSPVATIVAVRDGIAFRLRAPKPAGQYPDGANKAGFPVEILQQRSAGKGRSFLRTGTVGAAQITYVRPMIAPYTGRWDLRRLTNRDISPKRDATKVQGLLGDAQLSALNRDSSKLSRGLIIMKPKPQPLACFKAWQLIFKILGL
jgi:hypothetical protein